MKQQAYPYQPLLESNAIRLLELDPSDDYDAPLRGRLIHTRLSEMDRDIISEYTALSYVWGDPAPVQVLIADGHEVALGENLATALRDMRGKSRMLRVWADALCINQKDNNEKSHQVAMMGEIYFNAANTTVHLGALTEKTEKIMSKTRDASMSADEQLHYTRLAQKDLLRRPWFRRVWTYQEFALSKDPWMQCGLVRVHWQQITDLLFGGENGGFSGERHTGLEVLRSMQSVRSPGSTLSFLSVLEARRGFGATDPRDLIYAQLGIIWDVDLVKTHITISYDMEVPLLYGQVANYIITTQKHGMEALLSLLGNPSDDSRLPHLPSWAPDWRLFLSDTTPMHTDGNSVGENIKEAHCFIKDHLVLGHLGYEVDVVQDVSCTLPGYSSISKNVLVGYHDAVNEILRLYRLNGGAYYTGDQEDERARVSLRGLERNHRGLLSGVAEQWRMLLEPLSGSEAEKTSNEIFTKQFVRWITVQGSGDRVCAGDESNGLLHLMKDYLHTTEDALDEFRKGDDRGGELANKTILEVLRSLQVRGEGIPKLLEGKKLVRTKSGRFGVVPAQTQPGDLLLALANCRTLVTVRPTSTPNDDVNKALRLEMQQLRSNPGHGEATQAASNMAWNSTDGETLECTMVGASYLDCYTPWKHRTEEVMKLFAFY